MDKLLEVAPIIERVAGSLLLSLFLYCLYQANTYGDPHGIIGGIGFLAVITSCLLFLCAASFKRSIIFKVTSHSVLVIITLPITLLVFFPEVLPFE